MPKKIPSMFPRPRKERSWLYLIGTKLGTVKVGRTTDPRQRLATHRVDLAGNLAWCHLFTCSGDFEYGAIRALEERGTRIRKTESFSGLTKREAIDTVRAYLAGALISREEGAVRQREYLAYQAALKVFVAQYRAKAA